MRKKIFVAVAMLTAILMLTACGKTHEHTLTEWTGNATEHWYVCECGEKINTAEHTFDEYSMCSVCSMTVNDMGDGAYELLMYDEQGTMCRLTGYDAEGNVQYEHRIDNEYYEDGNPKSVKEYMDGVIISESSYLRCENSENGEVYMNEYIGYDTDTKNVSLYDEQSNLLSYTVYDKDGNVVTADIYTYEYDEDGNMTKCVVKTDGVTSRESFYTLDADGNSYAFREVFYNESGEIEQEYTYEQ